MEALIANITAQVEEVYANNPVRRNFLLNEVENLNNRLEEYTTQSTPTAQLFKGLMCRLPESVNPDRNSAPFFKLNPSPAYFGWLNDPLLMEVQGLLVAIGQGDLPWTNAVPGTSTNWTSMDDVRRRKSPVTMYTGKKNPKEVARYIRYNNMTTLWVCLAAMDSQDPDAYDPTTQFPACKLFEYEWDDATAEAMGYVRPFATDWANKIGGTDAQMWGRPVTSEKLEVFVDDIYRTAYMEFKKTVYDWHQIPLRRYGLQTKDMENYTQNPVQAQYYQFGPEGLENLTAATGVPAFVSKPHFLGCDPSLVAAVKGVSPRADIHDTYLDLEPQTGLLARAKKRLQANYYIGDWVLPVMDGDTAESFNTVCLNETRKDGVNCMGVNEQINCLATPSWSFKDGGVYFPYAWVEESMVLTRDDADDLKESLYWIDGFAESVQLYSLVCSGIFMAILMGMLGQSYLHNKVGNSSIEVSEFKSSMVDDETQAIYQKTALLEPEQQQMTNERNAAGEDF